MDLDQRADAIAMQAVKDVAGTGLRALSPSDRTQRIVDCLDTLSRLLESELDSGDLARFAAAALYRANYCLDRLLAHENSLDVFLTEIEQANQGRTGRTAKINAALAKLNRHGHPLVSVAIERGQAIGASLRASEGGRRGKAKTNAVHAYAVRRYLEGKWKNPRQASLALWSDVQEEAKRLGTALSVDRGPSTLYGWLLKAKKNTTSTSSRISLTS